MKKREMGGPVGRFGSRKSAKTHSGHLKSEEVILDRPYLKMLYVEENSCAVENASKREWEFIGDVKST